MKRWLLNLIVGLFLLSGCNTLAPMLFGFREINGYNAEQCGKFYKKLSKDFEFIPLICNEKQFMQVSELGADSMQMKNLYQPLKIMYFHGDELISFHINCYCPPTLCFNLSWNYNHQFDEFPPTTSVPLDGYTVKLSEMQAIFPEIKEEKNYTVLVFWTNMLHKVSKSEIKTVYKNLKMFGQLDEVDVYLINNDITMTKLLNETE
ncbi:MAG: hypothetical protein IJK78_06980 [Bacteroidales bacterium]|nr:hypothetical protein [Bacteroidales bacterium]